MIIRLLSPKKKWLLFNIGYTHGKFVDMFAEGYFFCLNYPQRINDGSRFKGFEYRKIIKKGRI